MDDIATQLTNLATQMTEGFTQVHTRQDVANGKLMKHEIELEKMRDNELANARKTTFWERNQDKTVWGIVGIALMLFYYLLTNNGFPHFLK